MSFCVNMMITRWLIPAVLFAVLVAPIRADFVTTAGSHALPSSTVLAAVPAQDHLGMWLGWPGDLPLAGTVRAAGATWTRVTVYWAGTESSPGVYNWAKADSYIQAARSQGYQVILSVVVNPKWAAVTPCGPLYPEHVATYANFMKAVVSRYSVAPYNIRYFELGNEPDNADVIGHGWVGGCWGKGHANSAVGAGGDKYAAMLKVVYPAMKAVNPAVQVVIGGLAYDLWLNEGGPFDRYFLDDLLAAGGGAYFDVINYHFYEVFSNKWGGIAGKGKSMQDKVRAVTGQTKPLMNTELGSPSAKPAGSSDPNMYSEEQQARYVFKGFAQGIAAGIYPMIWFQAADHTNLSGGYAYGLLRPDQSKKPGFVAFETLAAQLTGFTYLDKPVLGTSMEGYRFSSGSKRKTVVWRNATTALNVGFAVGYAGGTLLKTTKAGTTVAIADGLAGDLDGARNGTVVLSVDTDPIIVAVDTTPPTATRTPSRPPK